MGNKIVHVEFLSKDLGEFNAMVQKEAIPPVVVVPKKKSA